MSNSRTNDNFECAESYCESVPNYPHEDVLEALNQQSDSFLYEHFFKVIEPQIKFCFVFCYNFLTKNNLIFYPRIKTTMKKLYQKW